jgi:hypothetical protein
MAMRGSWTRKWQSRTRPSFIQRQRGIEPPNIPTPSIYLGFTRTAVKLFYVELIIRS